MAAAALSIGDAIFTICNGERLSNCSASFVLSNGKGGNEPGLQSPSARGLSTAEALLRAMRAVARKTLVNFMMDG